MNNFDFISLKTSSQCQYNAMSIFCGSMDTLASVFECNDDTDSRYIIGYIVYANNGCTCNSCLKLQEKYYNWLM